MEGIFKSLVSVCMLFFLFQMKVSFCTESPRAKSAMTVQLPWRIGQFHAERGNNL